MLRILEMNLFEYRENPERIFAFMENTQKAVNLLTEVYLLFAE
jgi:hypothetical protein